MFYRILTCITISSFGFLFATQEDVPRVVQNFEIQSYLGEGKYLWSVVGTPKRDYGWVLSRDPNMSDRDFAEAAHVLEANGYDIKRFIDMRHIEGNY